MSIENIFIICGDRDWRAPGPIDALCAGFKGDGRTVIITGGAVGADAFGRDGALQYGHRSMEIRAPWTAYKKLAGPLRNRWMLELLQVLKVHHPSAHVEVHAFHANLASSVGTVDMIKRARDAGVPVCIHSDPEKL